MAGTPSCTMFQLGPSRNLPESLPSTCISPGRFGSSNRSVYRMRFVRHQFDIYAAEGVALPPW